jgi:hypothetical protein
VTDTLAYEIGAVFFLAVLFMAGTLTRDLFPKGILKTVKAGHVCRNEDGGVKEGGAARDPPG